MCIYVYVYIYIDQNIPTMYLYIVHCEYVNSMLIAIRSEAQGKVELPPSLAKVPLIASEQNGA